MGEESTTSRTESGVAGGRSGYQIASLFVGIVQLMGGAFVLYVGVRMSLWMAAVAGLATLGLGIQSLRIYRRKKPPAITE